jgi:hypothetical protein
MNSGKFSLLTAIVVCVFNSFSLQAKPTVTQLVAESKPVVAVFESRADELAVAVDVGLPPDSSFERETVDEYKIAYDKALADKTPLAVLVSDNTLHPAADKAVLVSVLSKYRKELDEQWGEGEKLVIYRPQADGSWNSECHREAITPQRVTCLLGGGPCKCGDCQCESCPNRASKVQAGCQSCRRISYREPEARGNNKLDAALAEAKQDGKKVLAIFGMVGCEPCRKLKAELDKEPAKAALQKYKFVYLDSQEDHAAFDRYRVRVCPTTMILDPGVRGIGRSKAVKTATGFMSAGDLALWLKP